MNRVKRRLLSQGMGVGTTHLGPGNNGNGGGIYADAWTVSLGNEPCGKGGMVPSAPAELTGSIVTGQTWVMQWTGDDFWKIADTAICALWMRVSGASGVVSTFMNASPDFVATLRINGCTVSNAQGIPLEEILPTFENERQKLKLGFRNGSNNLTVLVEYKGTGLTLSSAVQLRTILLSSAYGCRPPREVLEIMGWSEDQGAAACGCSMGGGPSYDQYGNKQ